MPVFGLNSGKPWHISGAVIARILTSLRGAALIPARSALRLPLLTLIFLATAGASFAAGPVKSAISGINFKDAPEVLPVEERYSQAIQTIAADLGNSCQQIESYGWSIDPSQQARVNAIFTDTAKELSRLGYSVSAQSPGSAAADITVYSATRAGRNLLLTWSAGKDKLLLLMCQTQGEISGTAAKAENPALLQADDLIGDWDGTYSCSHQGQTGGTITVTRVVKERDGYGLTGIFSFYPTAKNPNEPRGSYRLKGHFDEAQQRAIFEPTSWIQKPAGYGNAMMIANFNADQKHVTALYEGISGCTSFEGQYKAGSADRASRKYFDESKPIEPKKKKVAPKPKAKPVVESAPVEQAPVVTPEAAAPAAPAAVTAPPAAAQPAAAPALPQPTITPVTPEAAAPAQPVVAPTPAPATTGDSITVPEKPPVQ